MTIKLNHHLPLTLIVLLVATHAFANNGVDLTNHSGADDAFATQQSTARFLTQTTFGYSLNDINALTATSASAWVQNQFTLPVSLNMPLVQQYQALIGVEGLTGFNASTTTFSFWQNAIAGQDQLRQRVAFALSEILVVSNFGGEVLTDVPEGVGYYMDLLNQNAFGNYRDLLEAVTYTPAMGHYLTYMGNKKADPVTGRKPDENYAREIMQLFSLGLVQLNKDGSQVLGTDGNPIEVYNNNDITGLAKVFTGLNASEAASEDFPGAEYLVPMEIFEEDHSTAEKSFLGTTIPANTPTAQSITVALDTIMQHPNVAPFIGRQLIQRLVTSNPSPAYIERVSTAFDQGVYQLPNGASVGDGRLGDLKATVAAILFDVEARSLASAESNSFGKLREPVLIFTQWARAFNIATVDPEYMLAVWDTSGFEALSQHPYRSKSVFNFFRPGFVAPGTQSGAAGLTVPELQLLTASSIPGYINFMRWMINADKFEEDFFELEDAFMEEMIDLDADGYFTAFVPDYNSELTMATQPTVLVDHLNLLLTANRLKPATKTFISNAIGLIPLSNDGSYLFGADQRVKLAILMILSTPDYLIQR